MSLLQNTDLRRLALCALGATGLASVASAQYSFSIDWHSPTVGLPDGFTAVPITEGDILRPATATGGPALGPLGVPGIYVSAGGAGLGLAAWPTCVGHPGGTPCAVELDAFSYGRDAMLIPQGPGGGVQLQFSVDEFAMAPLLPPAPPSIGSEFPSGDSSADVFMTAAPILGGPHPPFAAMVGNVGIVDGDGLPSGSGAVYPGTGLIEPNFPGFPNLGDNLDALDFTNPGFTSFPPLGVFFSLDAPFFDVASGVPNTGSAPIHGFSAADVMWSMAPGGPPVLFAPAPALGLDIAGGMDDLDALCLLENGSGVYEPSQQAWDWMGGGTDMLLFSVRRGSPVIGMPDSIFGIPIEEGDVLTTPLPTALGGVSPFPGIFVAAENLGLGTLRSGLPADDLNALDSDVPFIDCNGNGVADMLDILGGTSTDVDGNGVPDECEIIGSPGCFCFASLAPCANGFPTAGCRNSTGVGALMTLAGSGSVAADDLVLNASGMPSGVPAIFFFGTLPAGPLPFGDGLRCTGGNIQRTPVGLTSAVGTLSAGPGLAGAFLIPPFSTRYFQCWFRDPSGPCGSGFNTTNSHDVLFTP